MDIAITQVGNTDARPYLVALRDRLPKRLLARVQPQWTGAAPADVTERQVARLPDATPEEFALIEAEMAALSDTRFTLTGDGLAVPMPRPADHAVPVADKMAHPDWLPAPPVLSARESVIAGVMDDVLAAKPSGIPFPETAYAGQHKAAYGAICDQLGTEPMVDGGRTIRLADFANVKKPRRPRITQAVWDEVIGHLQREVRFFGFAGDWFADVGHLRVLYGDQVIFDLDFVNRINRDYAILEPAQQASLSLELGVNMALIGIGQIPVVGGMTANILGRIWGLSKIESGYANGVLSNAISKLRSDIAKVFEANISVTERCHKGLIGDGTTPGDWGNLDRFGQLVLDKELLWPVDAKPLRLAHALGFHYESLRCLLSLKSDLHTNSSTYDEYYWCLLQVDISHKKPVGRAYEWANCWLRLPAKSKDCWGNYPGKAILIGKKHCVLNEQLARWICGKAESDVSPALFRKLFGTDQSDVTDPELAIPDRFFDDVKHRENWSF